MQQYGNNGRPYGQNRDSLRSSGSSQRTTPPNDGASDTSRYGFNGEPLSRPPARTANGTVRRTRTDNSMLQMSLSVLLTGRMKHPALL